MHCRALVIGDDCDRSLMFAEICLTLVVKFLRANLTIQIKRKFYFSLTASSVPLKKPRFFKAISRREEILYGKFLQWKFPTREPARQRLLCRKWQIEFHRRDEVAAANGLLLPHRCG